MSPAHRPALKPPPVLEQSSPEAEPFPFSTKPSHATSSLHGGGGVHHRRRHRKRRTAGAWGRVAGRPEAPGARQRRGGGDGGASATLLLEASREKVGTQLDGERQTAGTGRSGRVRVLVGRGAGAGFALPLRSEARAGRVLLGSAPRSSGGPGQCVGGKGRLISSLAGFKISKWPIPTCLRRQK